MCQRQGPGRLLLTFLREVFAQVLALVSVVISPLQVKMWVQLLIPRIEDGNNFGVSIQVRHCSVVQGLGSLGFL